jgi:hypothetical protein
VYIYLLVEVSLEEAVEISNVQKNLITFVGHNSWNDYIWNGQIFSIITAA